MPHVATPRVAMTCIAAPRVVGRLLLAIGLLGTIAGTLRHYPHQLAYFNELAGGPYEGWRHMLGSSLDWGQDVLLARDFALSRSFRCVFRAPYRPHCLDLPGEAFWRLSKPPPADRYPPPLPVAISATTWFSPDWRRDNTWLVFEGVYQINEKLPTVVEVHLVSSR